MQTMMKEARLALENYDLENIITTEKSGIVQSKCH